MSKRGRPGDPKKPVQKSKIDGLAGERVTFWRPRVGHGPVVGRYKIRKCDGCTCVTRAEELECLSKRD